MRLGETLQWLRRKLTKYLLKGETVTSDEIEQMDKKIASLHQRLRSGKESLDQVAQAYCEMSFRNGGRDFNELSDGQKKFFFDRAKLLLKREVLDVKASGSNAKP